MNKPLIILVVLGVILTLIGLATRESTPAQFRLKPIDGDAKTESIAVVRRFCEAYRTQDVNAIGTLIADIAPNAFEDWKKVLDQMPPTDFAAAEVWSTDAEPNIRNVRVDAGDRSWWFVVRNRDGRLLIVDLFIKGKP